MMRLGILFNRRHGNHLYVSNTLTPFLRWKRAIAERGIRVTFHTSVSPALLDCERIMVINFFEDISVALPREIETMQMLRDRGSTVLFFDNTDSTGTTQFEVIEYVDRYLKKQLYRDRSLYRRHVHGLRLYCEFYHETFGVDDDLVETRLPLPPEHAHKLAVGWNAGLGALGVRNRFVYNVNKANYMLGLPVRAQITRDPAEILGFRRRPVAWEDKEFDIHYRASYGHVLETIVFGRRTAAEMLDVLAATCRLCNRGTVSRTRFMHELDRSKVILSPFGYGEICRRDFEAFLAQGLLVKPDMGHIETWPEYYAPGITYRAYKWDFSDFHDVLREAVGGTDSARVARDGYQRYRETIKDDAGTKFAQRLFELLTFPS